MTADSPGRIVLLHEVHVGIRMTLSLVVAEVELINSHYDKHTLSMTPKRFDVKGALERFLKPISKTQFSVP